MVLMVRIIFLFGPRTWSGNGVGIQNMGLQDDVRGWANEGFGEDHSCGTGSALSVARASMAVIGSTLLPPGCVDVRGWSDRFREDSLCSQGGRPARCFNVSSAHFPSDPSVLHLGMCLLDEASCCVLFGITHGCEFFVTPTGGGDSALHPPSPAASSTTAAGTSEEEGLHACPLPHIAEVAFHLVSGDFGGGRIGTFSLPPHNVREYLGGGRTGLPPRTVNVHLMPMAVENDELIYVPKPTRG